VRLLLVALAALMLPAVASAAPWSGTWSNDSSGTAGRATLNGESLRLDGPALGCAQPVVLSVHVKGSRLSGSGRDVPCNRGLRWAISGSLGSAVCDVRLPDGSAAQLRLALKRR